MVDVSSVNTWAYWDYNKKPHYTIYRLAYCTGAPHNMYIFRQRKGTHQLGLTLPQITAHVLNGSFRPFLIIGEREKPTHFRPFGAGA
jgi:hypothetical protein